MANPTTNFGWVMPTNTDLVTDLPADFNVFGQAVDTSMAQLKGGTTGQILSKTSATDMAFTWITNDVGDITAVTATSPLTGGGTSGAITVGIQDASTSQKGSVQLSDSTSTTSSVLASTPTATKSAYDLAAAAIPKSTITTSGDIIYGTGSSTVSRLGIGSTGQVLTVAAGIPSWATSSSGSSNVAGKNILLNSAMNVWQRGTSFTGITLGAYCADRWGYYRGGAVGGATWSRQTSGLTGIQYGLRAQRDSGNTSTQYLGTWQSIETINSYLFAGQTATISFYAKCGANYSATSNALAVTVITGTGTDQPIYSFTGSTNAITGTATLTTSYQRFSYTGTLSSSLTQIGVQFIGTPTGTAGANDWYEITGVQLEISSSATAYSPNTSTYQSELDACQRYYYRLTAPTLYASMGVGIAFSTSGALFQVPLPSQMRVAPTSLDFSTTRVTNTSSGWAATAMVLSTDINSNFIGGTQTTIGSASLTIGSSYLQQSNGSSNGYIGFSAEL